MSFPEIQNNPQGGGVLFFARLVKKRWKKTPPPWGLFQIFGKLIIAFPTTCSSFHRFHDMKSLTLKLLQEVTGIRYINCNHELMFHHGEAQCLRSSQPQRYLQLNFCIRGLMCKTIRLFMKKIKTDIYQKHFFQGLF